MQSGGWSLTWQGDQHEDRPITLTPTPCSPRCASRSARASVDYSADGAGVDVRRYSAVVMVAAEKPYAETAGDITFPASMRHTSRYPEDLAALERVSGKGVPVVTLLFSGRPVAANDLINRSDAFVAAWLPGTEGLGLADMLLAGRRRPPRLRLHRPPVVRLAGGRLPAAARRDPVPPRLRPVAVRPLAARPAARVAAGHGLPSRKPVIRRR